MVEIIGIYIDRSFHEGEIQKVQIDSGEKSMKVWDGSEREEVVDLPGSFKVNGFGRWNNLGNGKGKYCM